MNQNFHHKQNKTKPTNSILCKLDICAYQQTYIHTPTKLTKKMIIILLYLVSEQFPSFSKKNITIFGIFFD